MDDRIEALERLSQLREQGALSRDEFEAEKARWLGPAATALAGPAVAPVAPVVNDMLRKNRLILGGIALGALVVTGVVVGRSTLWPSRRPASLMQTTGRGAGMDGQGDTLTSILDFDDPAKCAPGRGLRTVFEKMRVLVPGRDAPAPISVNGVAVDVDVYRVADGAATGAVIAQLKGAGAFRGLRVTGLRTVTFPDSDTYSYQLRFDDPGDKVLRSLRTSSFSLRKTGQLNHVAIDDGEVAMGVEPAQGGRALTCALFPKAKGDGA